MSDPVSLRADLSVLEIVHTDQMPWSASPSPGVERKRLSLDGPVEAGRVTSIVRYAAGSRFPEHPHPDGEEILVLRGVFSDERGDHPAGTYLLNPEGYRHAPYSVDGCELFVKLRQYPGQRSQRRVDTTAGAWEEHLAPGVRRMPLYAEAEHPEGMSVWQLDAGAQVPERSLVGGQELLVIEGTLADEHGEYRAGTWVRYPAGTRHRLRTATGGRLYVKHGHLASP